MELNKEIHINQKKTQRIMHENGVKAFRKYVNFDELIFPSDQGWQYQSIYHLNELKKRNIRQSFSMK